MPFWNEMEGQTLDGLPLQSLLRSEGRTAWFATTDTDRQAAVVIVFEALNDEDDLQSRLESAARLQHENLMVIRRTGRAELEEDSVVYAVMEPFDQTLAEVLSARPLSTDETREVASSLLNALEAVEAAGLHHGHVDAAGVLAVGDTIKLRSDCLTQRQNESDAPGLAALIYNALTGRRFTNEREIIQLPAPFATFARAGFGPHGSLAAMRRVLTGPAHAASAPTPVPPARAESPAAAVAAAPTGSAIERPSTSGLAEQPEPRGPVPQAGIPRAALDEVEGRPRKRPGIAIAAVVIMVILLVLFWYMFKRPAGHTPINGESSSSAAPPPASKTPADAGTEPSAAATANPVTTPVAPAARTAPPAREMAPTQAREKAQRPSAAISADATSADSSSMTGERGIWHVVAYTYAHESTAQHKAAELASRYPQLEPQVYSPSGHAPFLVSLGGGMDRENAFARRDAARAAGMPQDTYAQNFRR